MDVPVERMEERSSVAVAVEVSGEKESNVMGV